MARKMPEFIIYIINGLENIETSCANYAYPFVYFLVIHETVIFSFKIRYWYPCLMGENTKTKRNHYYSAKPLPESMLEYYLLDHKEYI